MAAVPDPLKPICDDLGNAFNVIWDAANKAVADAFETGKAVGKAEAAAEMRDRLASVITGVAPVPLPQKPAILPPPPPMPGAAVKRRPRGSVKPEIIELLKKTPEGLRATDVALLTGLNENSVRGALNALAHDKTTKKQGDLWVLAAQK